MKMIKAMVYLIAVFIVLFPTATCIVEHSKAETVERMKMPELQSAENGDASAMEVHQFSELPGEATPSARTPIGQIEPTDRYTGAQSPPDGLYTLDIHNGKITKIEYIPAASLETGFGATVLYDQNGYTPQSLSRDTAKRILEWIAVAIGTIAALF
jgi:hypothetical protein